MPTVGAPSPPPLAFASVNSPFILSQWMDLPMVSSLRHINSRLVPCRRPPHQHPTHQRYHTRLLLPEWCSSKPPPASTRTTTTRSLVTQVCANDCVVAHVSVPESNVLTALFQVPDRPMSTKSRRLGRRYSNHHCNNLLTPLQHRLSTAWRRSRSTAIPSPSSSLSPTTRLLNTLVALCLRLANQANTLPTTWFT